MRANGFRIVFMVLHAFHDIRHIDFALTCAQQGFQPRIPVFGADAGIELLVHYEVVCVGQNPARRRQHVRPSGIRLNIHSNSVVSGEHHIV